MTNIPCFWARHNITVLTKSLDWCDGIGSIISCTAAWLVSTDNKHIHDFLCLCSPEYWPGTVRSSLARLYLIQHNHKIRTVSSLQIRHQFCIVYYYYYYYFYYYTAFVLLLNVNLSTLNLNFGTFNFKLSTFNTGALLY